MLAHLYKEENEAAESKECSCYFLSEGSGNLGVERDAWERPGPAAELWQQMQKTVVVQARDE